MRDAVVARTHPETEEADEEPAVASAVEPRFDMRGQRAATLDRRPPEPEPEHIPWSYGYDRITALAVDPERLYVYWEVTDDAIETARGRLGDQGIGSSLVLRVYDITGRLFDGTNAHHHFDQPVDRDTRQWFFDVGRPGSSVVIELGLRGSSGDFAKVSRSGRVDFPRRDALPESTRDWMTVRFDTGDVAARASASGFGGHGGQPAAVDHASAHSDSNGMSGSGGWHWWVPFRPDAHDLWREVDRSVWEELLSAGFHVQHHAATWESPVVRESWEAGPFAYPVEVSGPVRESFEGGTRVIQVGRETRVLFGPWHVVVRGLGAHRKHQVLARWEVHRTWAAMEGTATGGAAVEGSMPGPGALRVALGGGSEWAWLGASEGRMRGASEVFFLGASELSFGGASETRYLAASEWLMRGASERRFLGASGWQFGGASEQRYAGASEQRYVGASEQGLGGASEQALGGGSEQRLGSGDEGSLWPKVGE